MRLNKVMKEEIELLIKRAEKFERDASFDFKHKDNDIAMFHLGQAAQLLIKAKLLELKGSYEKTHCLRKLLRELISTNFKAKEINEFIEKYRKALRNLERAYISSRYLYEEFFDDEVEEAFKALQELKQILWKK